ERVLFEPSHSTHIERGISFPKEREPQKRKIRKIGAFFRTRKLIPRCIRGRERQFVEIKLYQFPLGVPFPSHAAGCDQGIEEPPSGVAHPLNIRIKKYKRKTSDINLI
ncbi:MAG: hypothetical protein KAI03_04285, partial [Candidatus Aureabacteria bacterium]|nr:hypothetical protein [Candidatus Auribacterota bacterium]